MAPTRQRMETFFFFLLKRFGVFVVLAVAVPFAEQLKWHMMMVGGGRQDIPGIWLSIRQTG